MASNIQVEDKFARLFTGRVKEQKFPNFLMLVDILLVILVTIAVESGFSTIKQIKIDWRTSLTYGMLDAVMNIAFEGPHITECQAENVVMAWYFKSQRNRRPDLSDVELTIQ